MSVYTSFENITIRRLSPICSYCNDVMNFITARVKRPVPQGAKDLGIYDETYYWQCQRCNNTSTDHLTKCRCERITINLLADRKPDRNFVNNDKGGLFGLLKTYQKGRERYFEYRCIFCISCPGCGKKLENSKFVEFFRGSEYDESECYLNYYHEYCLTNKQKDLLKNKYK